MPRPARATSLSTSGSPSSASHPARPAIRRGPLPGAASLPPTTCCPARPASLLRPAFCCNPRPGTARHPVAARHPAPSAGRLRPAVRHFRLFGAAGFSALPAFRPRRLRWVRPVAASLRPPLIAEAAPAAETVARRLRPAAKPRKNPDPLSGFFFERLISPEKGPCGDKSRELPRRGPRFRRPKLAISKKKPIFVC